MGRRGPLPDTDTARAEKGLAPRHDLPTVAPLRDIPAPPKRLLPEAKKEWRRLAPILASMGALTPADLPAFEALCQNRAFLLEAEDTLLESGGACALQLSPKTGLYIAHPYVSLRDKYLSAWRRSLNDFGLTPASRGRLLVSNVLTAPPDKTDPMEVLLSGGALE